MSLKYVAGEARNINLPCNSGDLSGQAIVVGTINGTLTNNAETTSPYNAVVDTGKNSTYRHTVRNVTAYVSSEENTFAAVALGDVIYYDATQTIDDPDRATKHVRLSKSPRNAANGVNKVFGKVVGGANATTTAVTVENVEVMQDDATDAATFANTAG